MGRIQTPISGITTTSTYEEGTTYSLVNLRPKNGALHPVAPRKIMQELSQKYDIVFVHQNNNYKNWIGVVNDDNYSTVYWDILSEQPKGIASYITGPIHSVQQIGNTVSLITSDNIYYLFYQNNNYTFLGELPQVPPIGLRTSDQMSHAKYYFVNEYGSGTVKPDNFIDATKGLVNKAMDVLVNGWTDKDGNFHEGFGLQLFDACFIRYAFRLFDGTLTKHSPPILIMPVRHIVGKEEEGNLDSIKTISYDFDGALRDESCVDVYGYRMYMHYDFGGFDDWTDIIKSVDIFLSQPIGISNIENVRNDMPTTDSPRTLNYNLIKGLSSEALKNVSNTANFYFMKSIFLGTFKSILDPELFPSTESDITKMENLIFQEVMSDDNFSNHKYGAGVGYTYNNRLHIANVKTTFFKGFNPDYFLWFNSYPGIESYNGFKYDDAPGVPYDNILLEVEINTGITNEKLYRYLADYSLSGIWKMFMSGFISYPDPRAKRLTIYRSSGGQWYRVFTTPLEKHNLLNLSFYISDGLKPIIESDRPESVQLPDTSRIISLSEPNKIKVSELSNPLNFPIINTYQVGNGTIMAMATNAIRISEGQFGQYPLYIFTTQGIYSLDVGQGEVVYSNKSAPTSYEIPTTSIVTSTPFGVVFTSARGICIIRGQEVQLLTPQLQEALRGLIIEFMGPMEGTIHKFNSKTFSEYLRELDNLVYDPYENELIICDKESEFNYVLNLYSQSFYQSTERIDLVVGNTFPELYVISDNSLKNYEAENLNEDGTPQRADVSFILRPLQYGMPYIKWLEKMQLFCTLYDVNPLVYISHSSMDGVNFKAMSGLAPKQRANYSTLETQRIAGNKFRDFLFCFGASLAPNSVINYLESWIGAEYKDNLMK